MRPFKLLHLQSTATFGGDESNSLILCRELPEMVHCVGVYFGEGPMVKDWEKANASVSLLRVPPKSRIGLMRAIRGVVERERPQGIFLSSIILLPLVLKALGSFPGPVLCHTGNPHSPTFPVKCKFALSQWILRPQVRPTMVHCSAYVQQSFLRSRFFRDFSHEVAISCGLPAADLSHLPREVGAQTEIRVGMTARLDPIKNHALLIAAMPLILRTFPHARLELIGDGSQRMTLEGKARDAGVGGQVHFHGRVLEPFPIARSWDLFLYATTEAEGFGAALAEAMSLGLPCVVTDIGPMREVGGDAVRYISPRDAAEMAAQVITLLQNREARKHLSAAASARARELFDGKKFAGRIRTLLGADRA